MNIRSLTSKLNSLLLELNYHSVDVMLLCETWHNADSVAIRRLRAEGYSIVESARPRTRRADESLGVNHGGVAIIAAAGVRLSPVNIGRQPTTLECVVARVLSGSSSCVVIAVYRPGSAAITAAFFAELADILDSLVTSADPIVLAGDVNIKLERTSDPHTIEFSDKQTGYGLAKHVSGATQNADGTLDVECTRDDLPAPAVDIIDIGLSDHRLLRWSSSLLRPTPTYVTPVRRCWRSFYPDVIRTDLLVSTLCDVQPYNDLDRDVLALLYDSTITGLFDRQVPTRSVTCRRRPSSLWFDDECRMAKRNVRRLARAARREGPLASSSLSAATAWRAKRLNYYDGYNTRIEQSALTPTSHIRVDCGGPSMNC